MDLLVTVRGARGGARRGVDAEIEVDPALSCGELAQRLARHVRRAGVAAPDGDGLVVRRRGRAWPVPAEQSVFDAGIVSGDELELIGPAPPIAIEARGAAGAVDGDGAVVLLEVTGGPATGRSVPLAPGRHVLGRGTGCAVMVDDPSLSASHLLLDVSPEGSTVVHPNPQATNGTLVNGMPAVGAAAVDADDTIVAGATLFVVRPAAGDRIGERDRLGQIGFNRLPYRRPVVSPRAFAELDAPPAPPGERRFPLVSILVPVVGAGAMAWFTKMPHFLFLAGLSPLMMLGNFFSEGQRSKRTYKRDAAAFAAAVDRRVEEVHRALDDERAERFQAAPDLPLLARHAEARLGRLWERPRGSVDLLDLRLGVGVQRSLISAGLRAGGDPALREPAQQRLAIADRLDMVPVTVNLDEHAVVGIHGDAASVHGLGASLAVQAACLHSPEDTVIAAALPSADRALWSWLKWLPHTRSVTSPLDGPHLVDDTQVDDLLGRLLDVCADRAAAARSGHGGRHWPRVLALFDESVHPDRALLSALLDAAEACGIVVVWLGRDAHRLPRQCRALVDAAPAVTHRSTLWFTDPEREALSFELAGVSPEVAESVARSLAPVRDASGGNTASSIPRVVTLLDAVGVPAPESTEVAAAWSAPARYDLATPLGMGADGPFVVDLVEHGPHTLVAGTSGSGKSELLQTLVAGLALRYPPERLNLLFIDYKGGAATSAFRDLPHTVGQVTNLDERLALRALASLRAELRRRMAILEGRARDLAEMLRVAPADAPPSLVIVADEFATLVKEVPGFVDGIVDIAQRGRSLGIHLVLATQRPAGAVNDNILANTNLRICLRVLEGADSSSVIGVADAAGIPVPLRGRALARTGPAAPVPFQCAWSGAPFRAAAATEPVTVRAFGSPGTVADLAVTATRPKPAGGAGPAPETAQDEETQLEVTVRACAGAAARRGLPPPRRPWVEPLGDTVHLDALWEQVAATVAADPGRFAVLGLADDPDRQSQFPVVVDLEASGGLAVFGAGGSGKTTLLRTVATGLAYQARSPGVRIYALDFAGRSLAPLTDLPQVSAVIMNDEQERTTRLLTVLREEVEQRRRLLAEARVESLSALRRQRRELVVPRVVVLLDGYLGFHSTFEQGPLYQWIVELQRLATEGRQVGVHLVMTTNRQLGVPTALLSALSARLILRMSSVDELTGLGVPRALAAGAELPDGRGFLDARTEMHVATASADPSGAAQAAAIAAIGARLREVGVTPAPPLVELPEHVGVELAELLDRAAQPLRPVVGVADLSLAPVAVDLTRSNLIVCGPPLSGRSTALATVARSLRAAGRPGGDGPARAAGSGHPQLVGVGGLASPLAEDGVWDVAGFGRSRLAEALDHAAGVVEGYDGTDVRVIVFVDTAEDLDPAVSGPKLDALARHDAVRVVAVVEPATLARTFSGWIADLKTNRSVLMLQPSSPADIETVAGRKAALRPDQPFPPGRGVLVDRRAATLVQVAAVEAPAGGEDSSPGRELGTPPQ